MGDAREGDFFPESSYHKEINARGLTKVTDLPFVVVVLIILFLSKCG